MKKLTLRQKLDALPTVHKISAHWKHMKADKESRHKNVVWKQTPITIVKMPVAIQILKKLPSKLRHRMVRKLSAEREFNPKKLVTYQPVISANAVRSFGRHPEIVERETAYVLGTEKGPCIWNGNHRAALALLKGKKFKAQYLDLTGDGNGK